MNNLIADTALNDCKSELLQIESLIQNAGSMSATAKYFTFYSLIKACGTIEFAFKTIISDVHNGASSQLTRYIDLKIRSSSMNPSYSNIYNLLKDFDEVWAADFKRVCNSVPDGPRFVSSLDSLNKNRNAFAHGQRISASFSDIKSYFLDSSKIIELLDGVVNPPTP